MSCTVLDSSLQECLTLVCFSVVVSCRTTGMIPTEFGQLLALEGLWLYMNKLVGSIPAQLGNLTGMKWLSFQGNQLSFQIPPSLGLLSGCSNWSLDQISSQVMSQPHWIFSQNCSYCNSKTTTSLVWCRRHCAVVLCQVNLRYPWIAGKSLAAVGVHVGELHRPLFRPTHTPLPIGIRHRRLIRRFP
jgi:hypothetical protein